MLKTIPRSLAHTARSIWSFLKNPTDTAEANMSTSGKLQVLSQVLLIDILICTALTGVIAIIEHFELYNSDYHAVAEMMKELPVWAVLVLGVAVVPLLEEFIFRFGLRFRQGFITGFFIVAMLVIATVLVQVLPKLWALGGVIVLAALLVLYLINAYRVGNYFEKVWPRAFRVIFYTVVLAFGFMHITNFEYTTAILFLAPVLVAPQLFGGVFMGYMRVKYGFFWGYYLHAAHNFVFLGLGLLFMSGLEEKLNISNENYTLKVEEHMWREEATTSRSHIGHDTISFENIKLGKVIADLLQKEQVSVQYEKSAHLGKYINLAYKGKAADMVQSRKFILAELQELYNFDVTRINVEQEMWDIKLGDSNVLSHHMAEDSGPSKVTVTPIDITLENVTLGELLKTVKEEFYINVTDSTAKAGRYNFKLAKNGFDQLREELQSKYGITMQPRKIMAEQAVVSFRPKP